MNCSQVGYSCVLGEFRHSVRAQILYSLPADTHSWSPASSKFLELRTMKVLKSNYFRAFMRFLFSHIGLSILVFVYCVLGAFLFLYFESDVEKQHRNETNVLRCAAEGRRQELISKIQVAAASGELEKETLKQWVDEYHNKTFTDNNTVAAYLLSRDACDAEPKYKWTLPSAVLFTVTTVSAIGYGNIVPTTDITQFILICYCLIGIPLNLMFLANIGSLFATVARFVFSRALCQSLWKLRIRNIQLLRASQALGTNQASTMATQTTRTNSPESTAHPHAVPNGDTNSGQVDLTSNVGAERVDRAKALMDEQQKKRSQLVVPKTFIFGVLAFYTLMGTMLFSWSEDWTYIESGYFNVVTLLTIGLGDRVPGWNSHNTTTGKVKMCLGAVYIMLGLGILFMGLNLVIEELINASKKAGQRIGLVKEEEEMNRKPKSNLERAVRRQVYF